MTVTAMAFANDLGPEKQTTMLVLIWIAALRSGGSLPSGGSWHSG
jgi:hypothetical protein